ncbi:TolC family protein [Comamonas sp. JC664]|uniref:TolC family protein n=1 Tax=Comamonas sp. JC664 TaxID=2801917 RepID=UPI001749A672|nr:TolC family protein [Comamonas sp. JC664]MBL0694117.1 TolC family protein [Comamonas sp. JC664]GHG75872.1 protein CyaE [Comamonas sp. KCTC 72670]
MTALALGFLGLVAAPGVGLAQAAQQRMSVSLEEAIARALKTSPQVAQAAGSVATTDAARRSAFGAYLPNLTANANSSLASAQRLDPGTGVVFNAPSDTYSAGVSASWNVFTGGQRGANSRQAQARSSAAQAGLTAQRASAVLDVERAYYEVLRAGGLEDVANSRIERAKQNAEAAERRMTVGSATRSDVLRARFDLTSAQEALLSAQTQHMAAALSLGRLIGEDVPVDAQPLEARDESPFALTEEALADEITARAPSVLAAEADLRAAEAGVSAARSTYLPTVRLSGGYDWFNDEPAFNGGRTSWSVRLGLSYPIFDGFVREERVVNARTQASVAQATLADTRRAVRSSVGTSLSQLKLAANRIALATESVEVAKEDLKVQQERYKLGATTILELLTSQENLVQAEINLVAFRFEYRISRAQLEALAGRPL